MVHFCAGGVFFGRVPGWCADFGGAKRTVRWVVASGAGDQCGRGATGGGALFCGRGFFLEECLGGVRTSAVRSAPCGGLWQAVLVISVAVAQRGEHFCAGWGFKKRHKSQIFIATSAPHALWGSARTSTCTQHVSIFR
jgi:hypothetical protein